MFSYFLPRLLFYYHVFNRNKTIKIEYDNLVAVYFSNYSRYLVILIYKYCNNIIFNLKELGF